MTKNSFNVNKTKEIVVDFQRGSADHPSLFISGSIVEKARRNISDDLTWTTNTDFTVKRVQQCLHFLRRLKRACFPPAILTTFYRGKCQLHHNFHSIWYGNCKILECNTLQHSEDSVSLPSIQDIFKACCILPPTLKQPVRASAIIQEVLQHRDTYYNVRTLNTRVPLTTLLTPA